MNNLREREILKTDAALNGRNELLKRVAIYGGIILIAFLLGFLPMWLSARTFENERDQARADLRQSVLQNTLATAAINARRGEFEPARQQASDFYTNLRAEVDSQTSVFDSAQRANIQPILAARDEIITLLARGDAASAERLADLYLAFTEAKNSAAEKK